MSHSTVRLGNGELDAVTELHRVNLSPENRFEASPLRGNSTATGTFRRHLGVLVRNGRDHSMVLCNPAASSARPSLVASQRRAAMLKMRTTWRIFFGERRAAETVGRLIGGLVIDSFARARSKPCRN